MSHPRVLVTDARRGSALAVIRSLGRRGWHVTAADEAALSPGLRSRFASSRLLYPSPWQAPDAAARVLVDAARRLNIDLLIPVTDDVILPLVQTWQEESPSTRLAAAPRAALEIAWDKWDTIELAGRLGVPVPRGGLVPTGEEAVALARQLRWPVVVKPRRSRVYRRGQRLERREVRYARDEAELRRSFDAARHPGETIVQEFCEGDGHGVELLLDEGRIVAAFQHHRLREVPPTGGASAYRESVPLDPLLLDLSGRLLAELRWTGLAMVEFKLTAGGPRLMEINGRIWGSLPLAVASGMDFPYRMARLFLEGSPAERSAPDTTYTVGLRSHDLTLEASWIGSTLLGTHRMPGLAYPRRHEALGAAASLFRPGDRWDTRAWADPLPLAVEGVRLATVAGERVVRRLRGTGGSSK